MSVLRGFHQLGVCTLDFSGNSFSSPIHTDSTQHTFHKFFQTSCFHRGNEKLHSHIKETWKFTRHPLYQQHRKTYSCCLLVSAVWRHQGRAVHLTSLNWLQTEAARWSVCQCQWITCRRSNPPGCFHVANKGQTSLKQSRSWLCLCCAEWFWFSLHSGWQAAGLGGSGWQSHYCAVGLEERGEALCHAVSTAILEC